MRAVLLAAVLAAPAAAQTIEVQPLAPPSETGAEAREETVLPGGIRPPGGETDDRRETVEFKRAPFRTTIERAPERIETAPVDGRPGAVLRLLDMMTAETEEVRIATGQTALVGGLSVALGACEAPADGAANGTRAWLAVTDARQPAAEPVFTGWMFADSPALSAMDHRRYDLWLISCTSSAGSVASGSE